MTHEPYTCIPARRGKKETVLCFALLILAALSFFFAARFPAGRAVGQLISVVLLLLFILISSKFLLTEYRYHLEDGTLSISLRQGSRVKQQGSIPDPAGMEGKEGALCCPSTVFLLPESGFARGFRPALPHGKWLDGAHFRAR